MRSKKIFAHCLFRFFFWFSSHSMLVSRWQNHFFFLTCRIIIKRKYYFISKLKKKKIKPKNNEKHNLMMMIAQFSLLFRANTCSHKHRQIHASLVHSHWVTLYEHEYMYSALAVKLYISVIQFRWQVCNMRTPQCCEQKRNWFSKYTRNTSKADGKTEHWRTSECVCVYVRRRDNLFLHSRSTERRKHTDTHNRTKREKKKRNV